MACRSSDLLDACLELASWCNFGARLGLSSGVKATFWLASSMVPPDPNSRQTAHTGRGPCLQDSSTGRPWPGGYPEWIRRILWPAGSLPLGPGPGLRGETTSRVCLRGLSARQPGRVMLVACLVAAMASSRSTSWRVRLYRSSSLVPRLSKRLFVRNGSPASRRGSRWLGEWLLRDQPSLLSAHTGRTARLLDC